MFDRIELGTYIIAAAIAGKKISFNNIDISIINTELRILKKMGIKFKINKIKFLFLERKVLKRLISKQNLTLVFLQIYKHK